MGQYFFCETSDYYQIVTQLSKVVMPLERFFNETKSVSHLTV